MAAQLAYPDIAVDSPQANAAEVPDYQCFSSLTLFSTAPLNRPVASPRLASAWAEAILCYWRACIANGSISLDKPLYLLDMAPQDGQLAWLILDELRRQLGASGLQLRPCYVGCHTDADSAAHAARHPYFKDIIAAGRYDLAYWNEAGGTFYLHHQGLVLQHADNPVVILGLGYFHQLASELVGIDKGEVRQIKAAVTYASADRDACEFDYQWQTVPTPMPALAEPLLAHYRRCCNGTSIMLPLRACAMVDALNQVAAGRSLLLAADAGVSNEQQIRLGDLYPPGAWRLGDPAAKVNFHALCLHQQLQGARVWHQQLDDEGMVLSLSWRDDQNPISSCDLNAVVQRLSHAHPDEICQLVTRQYPAKDLLGFLRLSHWDPQLLKASYPALIESPLELSDSARGHWQMALVNTWQHFLPTPNYDGFYYQVGLLAAHLGHFGLAKECFRLGLAWYGEEATDLYLLAWCEAASGGVIPALELLARVRPGHPQSLTLSNTLQERLQCWRLNKWHLPTYDNTRQLQLEPLGREHAASFLYQYRDRQIGAMTRLPEMESLDQVELWISEQQQAENTRACFALMHESWGFIGMVSMHCAGAAGYFYFWIGSDFQGQGFGQQAAQLLFAHMAQQGVTEIFTSAYEDNLRSINALTQLGFEQLPFRAKVPDHDLIFFHRPEHLEHNRDMADRHMASRLALCDLCTAIQSPVFF